MGYPRRLILPAFTFCLLAAGPEFAFGQAPVRQPERITDIATVSTGQIVGEVRDAAGEPLEGVVVSALGSSNAFGVSDKLGHFSLRQLAPGPYLVRAHREGFLTIRGTIVEVRPSSRTPSSLVLHREGATAPRLAGAAVGGTAIGALPEADNEESERSESGLAWRLRRLKRSVLRDAEALPAFPAADSSFMEPFEFLGRAMEHSARAATALFADISLDGQVDLLTTGAFDSPGELLQTDRTRSVAFFSVGSNVGEHGMWAVRAAMNQGDLNSWIVAGSYAARAGVPHRYEAGMSYSLQRYQGGNTAALAAVPDSARNVGAVFGYDEWTVTPKITLGYGASYAHYDYLAEPGLLSPRLTASYAPSPTWRLRGAATRQVTAPGAQEFLPPSRASWLPPQRTFAPLSRDGFRAQSVEHYEIGVDHLLEGATVGIRAFSQQIDNQLVTLFGLRQPDGPAEALGHYYVGSLGNSRIEGVGVSLSHAIADNLRGSVEYSVAAARWAGDARAADRAMVARLTPGVLQGMEQERVHDLMTSLEAEVPQSATRVAFFYRVSNAFVRPDDAEEIRGFGGRFDLQVNQALPFMNFMHSQWEMLLAVRTMFHEAATPGVSIYDEIFVVRPPKRLVGGLTLRF